VENCFRNKNAFNYQSANVTKKDFQNLLIPEAFPAIVIEYRYNL